MELLSVDKNKCLHCGICVDSCPACILELGPEGPECRSAHGCMGCGHCVAVCPVGALDNKYSPLSKMRPISSSVLPAAEAYKFLRMRRSIRCFKPEVPSEKDITRLLDICRYAPTATNSQCMYYLVIRNPEQIKGIADIVVEWMEEEIRQDCANKRYYRHAVSKYREGFDIVARKAPCLVFVLTKSVNFAGESSVGQCLSYAGLYAQSLGLGTTIAGFISECCLANYQALREYLAVAPKMRLVGCMMVGYPKYHYRLMPERQHLKVEFR